DLFELTLPRAGALTLALDAGAQLTHSAPERRQRRLAHIPDAGGDDTVGAGHPRHLTNTAHRIRHEMNNELCERRVERTVFERQRLRRRKVDRDAGESLA